MKKTIAATLLAASMSTAFAADANVCNIVIDYPAGGTSDQYVRLLQKNNPNIQIEYRPGGGGALAIHQLNENKNYAWFGSPVFALSNSPVKDPPVELVRILVGAPILAVTNKNITWEQILSGKKINIGVPAIGTSHQLIGLQLKEHNPNIEVIPTSGDNKALPMVMNGDLDVYLISATAGLKWIDDFKVQNIFTVTYNKPFVKGKVELNYLGFNGIFVHKDATPEQKAHLMACVETATTPKDWQETLKKMGAEPIDLTGAEKDKAFAKFVQLLRKYNQ